MLFEMVQDHRLIGLDHTLLVNFVISGGCKTMVLDHFKQHCVKHAFVHSVTQSQTS